MSLLCALISAVAAQSETIPDATPQEIVIAVFIIILGLAATFFGLRLFRPMMFLAGFFFSAVIAYSALSTIQNISELWLHIGSLLIGILGGLLAGNFIILY